MRRESPFSIPCFWCLPYPTEVLVSVTGTLRPAFTSSGETGSDNTRRPRMGHTEHETQDFLLCVPHLHLNPLWFCYCPSTCAGPFSAFCARQCLFISPPGPRFPSNFLSWMIFSARLNKELGPLLFSAGPFILRAYLTDPHLLLVLMTTEYARQVFTVPIMVADPFAQINGE